VECSLRQPAARAPNLTCPFLPFRLCLEPQNLTPYTPCFQAAEDQVKTLKRQSAFLSQLAAKTVPKGLHCLSQRLTVQHSNLPPEERWLRPERSRLEVRTTTPMTSLFLTEPMCSFLARWDVLVQRTRLQSENTVSEPQDHRLYGSGSCPQSFRNRQSWRRNGFSLLSGAGLKEVPKRRCVVAFYGCGNL
jgi:hypothetical protein